MFLRNYDNMLVAHHLENALTRNLSGGGVVGQTGTEFGDGTYNCKTTDGVLRSISIGYEDNPYFFLSFTIPGICLGNGSEPVTYDDYKLSGTLVTNNLTQVSTNVTWDAETKKYRKTLVATYHNSESEDITISEWGLWRIGSYIANNAVVYRENSPLSMLVYREVFDEPLIIAAGTTATIKFAFEIPMPNHP